MQDNKKSILLEDHIKMAIEDLGATKIEIVTNPSTFSAIAEEIEPAKDGAKWPTWKGYRISYSTGMIYEAKIYCMLDRPDGSRYRAALLIADFEEIDQ